MSIIAMVYYTRLINLESHSMLQNKFNLWNCLQSKFWTASVKFLMETSSSIKELGGRSKHILNNLFSSYQQYFTSNWIPQYTIYTPGIKFSLFYILQTMFPSTFLLPVEFVRCNVKLLYLYSRNRNVVSSVYNIKPN